MLISRTRIVKTLMIRNQINTTTWQVYSQDMNLIENIWLYVNRHLKPQVVNINTKSQLIPAVGGILETIPVVIKPLSDNFRAF